LDLGDDAIIIGAGQLVLVAKGQAGLVGVTTVTHPPESTNTVTGDVRPW
jgi:hypothetical protein